MSHIHTLEESTIYATVLESKPAMIGCVTTPTDGEADDVAEKRWNAFVATAASLRLAPADDEPYLTYRTSGKTFDHYILIDTEETD